MKKSYGTVKSQNICSCGLTLRSHLNMRRHVEARGCDWLSVGQKSFFSKK